MSLKSETVGWMEAAKMRMDQLESERDAAQAEVAKLREENAKKDEEIARLKREAQIMIDELDSWRDQATHQPVDAATLRSQVEKLRRLCRESLDIIGDYASGFTVHLEDLRAVLEETKP